MLIKACFPPGEFCPGEQRKKQFDWLATDTDDHYHPIIFTFCLMAASRERSAK
jgi:hypothetical protein